MALGGAQPRQFLRPQALVKLGREDLAVRQPRRVPQPLPELGARDFGRGRIFHQIVDGDRPIARQPGGQVLYGHADVQPDPGLGDGRAGHVDGGQLLGRHVHVVTQFVFLVRAISQRCVKHSLRHRHQVWVAHPDLVPVAKAVFDAALGDRPHQKDKLRDDVHVTAEQLAAIHVPGAAITEAGVRLNISVAVQYLAAWLAGNGAVAINNLMEDTATAEISRAQLWQWLRHAARLSDGKVFTPELYERLRSEELARLGAAQGQRIEESAEILDQLVLNNEFVDLLTLIAYPRLP